MDMSLDVADVRNYIVMFNEFHHYLHQIGVLERMVQMILS